MTDNKILEANFFLLRFVVFFGDGQGTFFHQFFYFLIYWNRVENESTKIVNRVESGIHVF